MRHSSRGRSRRDFWRAWRDEMRQRWVDYDESVEGGPPPPPEEVAHAWREFFHSYMGDWPEHHWMFSGRRFSPWHQGEAAFNPFVATLLSKGGGLLPLYALLLLSQKPRYGNEIMALIGERTRGQWVANPGAIYPLMNTLEAQGLIEGQWDDPTRRTVRIYHITESGERELNRLRAVVGPKLREALDVLADLADDLARGGVPGEDAGDE
jgi:PadR family transcriptional regulator PadR